MHRAGITIGFRVCACVLAVLALASRASPVAECPQSGGSLRVVLQPARRAGVSTATIFGFLTTPSCDDAESRLAGTYAQTVECDAGAGTCAASFIGLRPGTWTHRILVTEGEASGQYQGRSELVLDASAGMTERLWPLYRTVVTVTTLNDALECVGCLRSAILDADAAVKPALIQFAPELTGSIRLSAPLPPITADQIAIDGLDSDGVARRRTIDGNGFSAAALRLLGGRCRVDGLRIVNVGGDSDAVLLEGPGAIDNVLESLEVVGRSIAPCGTNGAGCVVDGRCVEPSEQNPRGVCGDDGIAVRTSARARGFNQIRRCVISGAHDKGVKVSDGGAALVEDSLIFGNTDGGLQATLSGELIARHNVVIANRGTTSANGLAANGAAIGTRVPSRLTTQGNLSIGNTLRGISVRSLSEANLRDDFVCGNGLGVVLLDAAGTSASANAGGLAVVHNAGNGVAVSDNSRLIFGRAAAPGANAVAFNGPPRSDTPENFHNLTDRPIAAIGNAWEHCGPQMPCDLDAVQALDISTDSSRGTVDIEPALATRRRAAPTITAIEPTFAAAGELVRIYGEGFDAIEGIGAACDATAANTCRPLRGNCVLIDRVPAEVIAVTPTMLVIRAPFTCVAPVQLATRTRWSHGLARAQFCVRP